MINLATFEEMTHGIKNSVERVERLKALKRQIIGVEDELIALETDALLKADNATCIDYADTELQAQLENLICAIDTEIARCKREADVCHTALVKGVFSDDE